MLSNVIKDTIATKKPHERFIRTTKKETENMKRIKKLNVHLVQIKKSTNFLPDEIIWLFFLLLSSLLLFVKGRN